MRPSLLPGLLAAARAQHRRAAPTSVAAVRDRPALSRRRRAADARPRARRRPRGRATGAAGKAQRVRRLRRQGRGAGAARRRRRAGRQSAGAGRRRPASIIPASRAGSASARRTCWPSSARSIPRIAQGVRPRRAGGRGRDLPRRDPAEARRRGHMRSAYAPPPLQAVTRDFAFLVPAELAADQLLRAVRGADKAAIAGARLFDVFTGPGVPEGQKSLAVEVTLQPGEKSFTDEELKAISDRIVAAAAKLGRDARGPEMATRSRGPGFVRGAGALVRAARLALHRAAVRDARPSCSTAATRSGARVLDWPGDPARWRRAGAAPVRRAARSGRGRAGARARARSIRPRPCPTRRRSARRSRRRSSSRPSARCPGSTARRRPTRSAARRC